MQQFIQKIQELAKKEGITIANCHLKEILKNFNFFFYPDTLQTKEGIKQFENNYKIIVIDECIQNGIKYYVLCFDYNIIIFPNEGKAGDSILQDILKQFNGCETYFIQNYNMQSDTDNSNSDFFKEIRNFSIKFSFRDKKLQSFWSMIVNCVSGFLIKKGYQNSRNKHDKYLNEKFVEHQEKRRNFVNKSYIELRELGRGSGGMVKLIYYISKEEVYALKLPHGNCDKLNKRERNNFLNIRYPYIVPYIGYIEFPYHPKYLLLEYVEGETLDKYNLANLNEQEKYIIIFELLLTIQYLHSQHYICRDLRCGNIMINQNKDAILIDFDHVLKDDDKNKETLEESKERTNNFIDPAVPDENKTYKSDIYSLSYIIHFILYGKPQKINDKLEINENFIFKSCLDTEPTKRPDIIKMTKIFCENIFFYIKFEDLKVQHLISLDPNHNIQEIQFNLGNIYFEGRYIARDINKGIHYYSLAANQNDPQAQYNLGLIYSNGECITRDTSNDTLKKNQIDTNVIFEIKQFEEECTSQSKEFEIQLQNEINKLQEIQKEMAKNREKQNEKLTQIQMMLETNQKSSHISEEFDIKSDEVIEFKLGSKNIKTMKIQILNQNFHQLFALYEKNQNLNHPNILKSNGFLFDDEKSPSIILFEFCPINLEQGIKKKMLSKVKLMYSIYQILETMKYLHSKQVTHINLNPSNIFINKDGLIKICMFDISPPMSTDDHKNLNDKESDIYSFGVLIYFLLSGGEFPWSNTPVTFSSIAQKMINECLGSANKMSFDVISSILMIENYNLISLSQQKIHEISEIVNKYKSQNPVSNNS